MKFYKGVTLLELVIVLVVMAILAAAIMPQLSHQAMKSLLNAQIQRVLADLRYTQQMAISREGGYGYYGVQFYNNLEIEAGKFRSGYKILRYEPALVSVPLDGGAAATVIKGPVSGDNPKDLDLGLAFDPRVVFGSASRIAAGGRVIFFWQGSATSNGQDLLVTNGNGQNNTLTLNCGTFSKTIVILPVTGNVDIQ